jgi:hypothetical protein
MTGKVRKPAAVVLLSVVTLGLYPVYWWYAVNKELRELGRSRGKDLGTPLLSALAFFFGGCLIVPFVWTAVNTSRRISWAQRETGARGFEPWVAVGLLTSATVICVTAAYLPSFWVAALIAGTVMEIAALAYMQSALNALWKSERPASRVPLVGAEVAA